MNIMKSVRQDNVINAMLRSFLSNHPYLQEHQLMVLELIVNSRFFFLGQRLPGNKTMINYIW